jgi:hypothetical protein
MKREPRLPGFTAGRSLSAVTDGHSLGTIYADIVSTRVSLAAIKVCTDGSCISCIDENSHLVADPSAEGGYRCDCNDGYIGVPDPTAPGGSSCMAVGGGGGDVSFPGPRPTPLPPGPGRRPSPDRQRNERCLTTLRRELRSCGSQRFLQDCIYCALRSNYECGFCADYFGGLSCQATSDGFINGVCAGKESYPSAPSDRFASRA